MEIEFPVQVTDENVEYVLLDLGELEQDFLEAVQDGVVADYTDAQGREIWWKPTFYLAPEKSGQERNG